MTRFKILFPIIALLLLSGCDYTVLKSESETREFLDVAYMSGVYSQITKEYNRRGEKSTYFRRVYLNVAGRIKVEEEFDGYRNSFNGYYVIVDDFLVLRDWARKEYPEMYLIRYVKEGFELERVSGDFDKESLIEDSILLNGRWLENSGKSGSYIN